MLVEVRSITLAPGAPARDEAAGRGDGRRRDRRDEGDVLQPAVARAQLPARHAADAHTASTRPATASAVSTHAPTERGARPPATTSPSTRRPRASPRRRSSRWCREHRGARASTRSSRCRRGCARASACPTRPARSSPPTSATTRAARRRLAFEELLLDQLVQLRAAAPTRARRAARRPPLAEPPTLTRRWLAEQLPFTPTGDQRAAIAEVDADLARERPMQRLLMGEVGSGKTVVALHAMLRAVEHGTPGGADGADRDARRAALRDAAGADAGRTLVPAALLTGSTPRGAPARDCSRGWPPASCRCVVGTHALIEDTVEFDRPRASWSSTSSTASASPARARSTPRRRPGWRRTCCT